MTPARTKRTRHGKPLGEAIQGSKQEPGHLDTDTKELPREQTLSVPPPP